MYFKNKRCKRASKLLTNEEHLSEKRFHKVEQNCDQYFTTNQKEKEKERIPRKAITSTNKQFDDKCKNLGKK